MNEKVNKFIELNKKLTELIAERIVLARDYYQEKMPKFIEGNIIFYNKEIYIVNYLSIHHDPYIFRQHFDGDRIEYRYDNQIEKEYNCNVIYDMLNTTGKAKRTSCFWLNDASHEHCEVICNVKDFDRIAKENGFKKPKLNKYFVTNLYHKIKENLEVTN
jgi:hypothetical protein